MFYFSPKSIDGEAKQNKNKMPDSTISIDEFKSICYEKFGIAQKVWLIFILNETPKVIFFHLYKNLAKVKIDFEIFVRLFFFP